MLLLRLHRKLESLFAMSIRVLCLGDIVGKPGRHAVAEWVPKLTREYELDLVIANAENSAGGSGLTPTLFEKIRASGVDVCTLGDHTYRKKDIFATLEQSDRLIRPGNFPTGAIGKGWTIIKTRSGLNIGIMQVIGRNNINLAADDPFRAMDRMLLEMPRDLTLRIVDFHAEQTSEKVAMGWYLNGRVSAVVGTHTHVPTADQRVLAKGTAYVSDLGMCGPWDSILGRRTDRVLKHMLTSMPTMFDVALGHPRLSGVILTLDPATGKALAIERCDRDASAIPDAYDRDDHRRDLGD